MDVDISTKFLLASGDIHSFHFSKLRIALEFVDDFENFLNENCLAIQDEIESISVLISDGVNTINVVL